MRRPALVAGVVTGVVTLVLSLVGAAWAVFTDTASVVAGPATGSTTAFTSGSLGVPGTPVVASQPSATGPLALSWTAASVTGGGTGATPSGYEVLRWSAATGGTSTIACTTTTALTCSTTAPTSGAAWFTVRARIGGAWVRESGRAAWTDTVGPSTTFTQPTNGLSLLAGALAANVATACGAGAVACGTASDSSTLVSAQYRLTRTGGQCWNGSAWVGSGNAACATGVYQAGTLQTSTPTTTSVWRVPGTATTAYSILASHTLAVRLTDAAGNRTDTSITFSTLL
ncbi:hypothetical protein [Nocardioides zeae]